MADVTERMPGCRMSETEKRVRYGIGAGAAAAAIFAPIRYRWKGLLTAVAAQAILSAVCSRSFEERLNRAA
jgi:hypothetical protein